MRARFLVAVGVASLAGLDAVFAVDAPGPSPSPPEVLSAWQIQSVLPEPPSGWIVAETTSNLTGAGPGFMSLSVNRVYRKSKDYDRPAVNISITAHGKKVEWVHDLPAPGPDAETEKGFHRTVTIDGYRVTEYFDKAVNTYSLGGAIDRRFLFTITSTTENTAALAEWFKRTKWKTLAALQPAPEPEATPAKLADLEKLRSKAKAKTAGTKAVSAPAKATRETPYENSLGMRFAPVSGTNVLFSIWETRVKDFEVFARATDRTAKQARFKQTEDDPVILVSWGDATEFCQWLTKREREAGKLGNAQIYRLPTDREWSVAVGIPDETTGPERFTAASYRKWGFPWGKEWPPPDDAGNYSGVFPSEIRTAPVGLFSANRYGLFDLGGNVSEWCQDWENFHKRDNPTDKILRGASWYHGSIDDLFAGARKTDRPQMMSDSSGFRCVLAEEASR